MVVLLCLAVVLHGPSLMYDILATGKLGYRREPRRVRFCLVKSKGNPGLHYYFLQ